MKVFLSWSGERGKALALALREWLPLVLHYVQPWHSESDIDAGVRWSDKIADELADTDFGIICVTSESLESRWILFEAGAISKSIDKARVVPLLFDLDHAHLGPPLSQFQAKKMNREDFLEILESINDLSGNKVPPNRLSDLYYALWSRLEDQIKRIPTIVGAKEPARTIDESVEELIVRVRGMESRLETISGLIVNIMSIYETHKILSDDGDVFLVGSPQHPAHVETDIAKLLKLRDNIINRQSLNAYIIERFPGMKRSIIKTRGLVEYLRLSGIRKIQAVDNIVSSRYEDVWNAAKADIGAIEYAEDLIAILVALEDGRFYELFPFDDRARSIIVAYRGLEDKNRQS